MNRTVEFTLDASRANRDPDALEDFVEIVDFYNDALVKEFVADKELYEWENPDWGRFHLKVIGVPPDLQSIDLNTELAVHAVTERPRLQRECKFCRADEGESGYAPFRCAGDGCGSLCCDNHATILDGSLKAFCPNCVPQTESKEPPAFWCLGPHCSGRAEQKRRRTRRRVQRQSDDVRRIAWPESQRKHHPDYRDVAFYCPRCYEYLFTSCQHDDNCNERGVLYCEFVFGNGETCDRRMCNTAGHRYRWQIYGPQADGLCLCKDHRNIGELSPAEVFIQMAAGTIRRNDRVAMFRNAWGHGYSDLWHRLPTLHTIQYIFHNTLDKHAELRLIRDSFSYLVESGELPKDLTAGLKRNIEARQVDWQKEIERDDREKQEAQPIFRATQNALGERPAWKEEAESLRFSAYKKGDKRFLYAYFDDPSLQSRFRAASAARKDVGKALGIFLNAERDRLDTIFGIQRKEVDEKSQGEMKDKRGWWPSLLRRGR